MQAIANYRMAPPVCEDDADFLSKLNNFYRRFDAVNSTPAGKTVPQQHEKAVSRF